MKSASALLTVPKAAPGEMLRQRLTDKIEADRRRIVFVHAAAGYGKTTILAQLARNSKYAVWLSLIGETDVLAFADTLCEAVRRVFPQYNFQPSECLPFITKENFISIMANALIGSMEYLSDRTVFVFDDLHTVRNSEIKELLTCFMRFSPDSMRLLLGSRETPWPEFAPLKVRGSLLEIGQDELAFTERETEQILGLFDGGIYRMTEGWPLAVGSFRVLLENGVSPTDIPAQGSEILSSYLFYECISRLPSETVDFLKDSSCFDDLDASMLDTVLERQHSALILDSLTARNLFTVKTGEGHYRCHALFQKCLQKALEPARIFELWRRAALYYLEKQDFRTSAEYAIKLNDHTLLKRIILIGYRPLIRSGSFGELRQWFQMMGEDDSASSADFLLAKGAFFSFIGNFTEAKKVLDRVIPLLDQSNRTLYMEAMLHKARVLRNDVSFEASDELLNRLLPELAQCESETACLIVIEKLYNLCWNSRMKEACALGRQAIEYCAREGKLKIKSRLESYMTAVHFFEGNMREAVASYEKSLALPEESKDSLDIHGTGIYAAKAYQMLGNRERSLDVLNDSLNQMKRCGKYEEMWSGYLFAAEIHFQNALIDRSNGLDASYEITKKYFALADEYAPLYRKATYQQQWARLQRLTYSVMFEDGPKDQAIEEIFLHLDDCSDYFKSIILARLMGYFAAVHDIPNAFLCAKRCAEVGENTGAQLHSSLAYGTLTRCCLAARKLEKAKQYAALFLRCCSENGIYEYFKLNDYGPVLQFAYDNNIERNCAEQFMAFSGYKTKKGYVQTFGGLSVFPFNDRSKPIKLRTRKERELFAFLLDAGEQGVTKEQIYTAIWSESESKNIMGLIGVNLAQLKKDLAPLGIEPLILCHEKRYRICREELVCDFELFKRTAENPEVASEDRGAAILSLYSGQYLADFEAFWAAAKRIEYQKIYEDTLNRFQSNKCET